MEITMPIVNDAIKQAIEDAQLSIRTAYHVAVRSARKDNLFADVLLSCALAEADELGYFAAQHVRAPMQAITGKMYEIPTYAKHLNDFSDQKRGCILKKDGVKRRYRYRFQDPLMQPFVIMQGVVSGKLAEDYLSEPEENLG